MATGPCFFASLSPNMTAMVSASASFTKWLIMSEFTGTPASTKSWSAPLLVPTTEKQELQIMPRNMVCQPNLHSYSLERLIYGYMRMEGRAKDKKRSKSTCLRRTDNSIKKASSFNKATNLVYKQVSLFNMTSSPPLQKLMNVTSVLMSSAENNAMSTPQ